MAATSDYTKDMQAKMGTSLSYRHEDGMNYALAFPRIIVGSCPQTADDVNKLQSENVGVIFCLQEDNDMKHFDLDIVPIQDKAAELNITHVRCPIKDFDPFQLRQRLPEAVRLLQEKMEAKPDQVAYIHCTAGLGRAPGTALAYQFWMRGMCLDEAYAQLFSVRRCHPQIGMIRAATCDMLAGNEGSLVRWRTSFPAVRDGKHANVVEVAGLDVGWGDKLALELDSVAGEFVLNRELHCGIYQYKFIIDGEWMPNEDLPTVNDNGNINNLAEVAADADSLDGKRRNRLMAKGGLPTSEELDQIQAQLRA